MGRNNWLEKLMDGIDLPGESLPDQTLVEIAGERRVLVENHRGVTEYGTDRIRIQVKYGTLCVCGDGLEMKRMSRRQLIITGKVEVVNLVRRNG